MTARPAPDVPETRATATEAKQAFGALLDRVVAGGRVVITRHEAPKAVLLSIEEYRRLAGPQPALEDLRAEFDTLVARLQTPAARRGLRAAFDASPAKLGRAAARAARARASAPARRRGG